MLIGELAATVGVAPETVRFYERRGLLPEPDRAPNGYRRYGDAAVTRLRFIRSAQSSGLTLDEIRAIIDLRDDGVVPCGHVDRLLRAKLADVRRRRHELAALERELEELVIRGRSLDPADCGADDICQILAFA